MSILATKKPQDCGSLPPSVESKSMPSGGLVASDSAQGSEGVQGQRDTVAGPKSRLFETETEFQMMVAVPYLKAKDIIVSALPESIVVETQTMRGNSAEDLERCEAFGATRILRRFDLRPGIDVATTWAALKDGILTIVAPKLPDVKERRIPIAE